MRGYHAFNFPAFHAAAADLRARGHTVFNPAEADEAEGFNPLTDPHKPLKHYMEHDLAEVCQSDAVVVLPNWHDSQGAKLEVYVARECDVPVLDATTLEPVPIVMDERCQQAARDLDIVGRTGMLWSNREYLEIAATLLREVRDD
jgi:hypothetical protein